MHGKRRFVTIGLMVCLPMLATAQETGALERTQTPPPHDRLHEITEGPVRVTTAVPSADETKVIFGANLYRRNVQPVWVQVENLADYPLWFLPVGLDSLYFTPMQAAYRSWRRQTRSDAMGRDFYRRGMGMYLEAGGVRSGYVFTRVDEGTKSFNVDIIGDQKAYLMTFFVPVPGLRLDHYEVDWENLYSQDEIQDVDLAGLAAYLESLPCCVTDKKGKGSGDPLNIAFVGSLDDLYYAFMRAGWDETETVYGASLWQMGISSMFKKAYRYSPVSALYVFERPQDFALQKARESIDERNHLRVWATPIRYEGKHVWVGQISRDIGVRFTKKTIMTHKIDPHVDETREYLVENLAYAESLARLGYVGGVGAAGYDEPRGNLTGDPYFTDGQRAVMWIPEELTVIGEIELIDLSASQ